MKVKEVAQKSFKQPLSRAMVNYIPSGEEFAPKHIDRLVFGDYMIPDADNMIYDEASLTFSLRSSILMWLQSRSPFFFKSFHYIYFMPCHINQRQINV